MPERLLYHFEPQKGWMNDPNGLIYYKGQYHAFFQHNPYGPVWGVMHWGHAVSEDLIHWKELPIALYPDKPYDKDLGCWSGSAVEKDGRLYLFYTSVSHTLGQTQSVAFSDDGVHFEKYKGNPVIPCFPDDGSKDFRDPKVTKIGGEYFMVCGSGKEKTGRILLFKSRDLLRWEYGGVLYENAEYGAVFECPDFFPLGDKFVLMFSQMGVKTHSTVMLIGNFDGRTFTTESAQRPEAGPIFYAPQTFLDDQGRRIMIGWFYGWGKEPDEDAEYTGALTIPREITVENGRIKNYPVAEAAGLLKGSDEHAAIEGNTLTVTDDAGSTVFAAEYESIRDIRFLRDTRTLEGFVNGGEDSFSVWLN